MRRLDEHEVYIRIWAEAVMFIMCHYNDNHQNRLRKTRNIICQNSHHLGWDSNRVPLELKCIPIFSVLLINSYKCFFSPLRSYVGLSPPHVLWMLLTISGRSAGGKQCQYVIQTFLFAVVLTDCYDTFLNFNRFYEGFLYAFLSSLIPMTSSSWRALGQQRDPWTIARRFRFWIQTCYGIDPDAEICGPHFSESCSNSCDGQASANVGGDDDDDDGGGGGYNDEEMITKIKLFGTKMTRVPYDIISCPIWLIKHLETNACSSHELRVFMLF
jgi:hypothetical protein